MFGGGSEYQNSLYENIPNASLAFTMWSTTFGNGNFVVMPPQFGDVSDNFPTIPYLSLEALVYNQMSSNPITSPTYTSSGSNSGQQVISATQTASDASGTNRYLIGNQNTQ